MPNQYSTAVRLLHTTPKAQLGGLNLPVDPVKVQRKKELLKQCDVVESMSLDLKKRTLVRIINEAVNSAFTD